MAPQTRIAHQVNCRGKMGSGVALAIKQKYPEVYQKYSEACKFIKKIFYMALVRKLFVKIKLFITFLDKMAMVIMVNNIPLMHF